MPNEQLILPGQQVRAADVIHLRRMFNALVVAGKGLVGGGPISDDINLDIGQGDGLLVTEDAVAVDLATTAPPATNLTAGAVGTATKSARENHRHLLDQAIVPTWTGAHTFNAAVTINGGLDIDSSVFSRNGVPIVLGSGAVATDTIWDAAGDLAVGTGADTAAKLTKGADGTLLGMVAGAVGWVSALAANFVDGAAIRLANAQWLRARNAANTADVNLARLNTSNQIELGAPLVLLQTALSADIVCTSANVYYDGPSVTLTAGTWLLMGSVQIVSVSAGAGYADAKLWDGTTAMASGELYLAATGLCSIALMGIAAISSTTTYSIAVATQQANARIKAAISAGGLGAGNNASTLRAVKIG